MKTIISCASLMALMACSPTHGAPVNKYESTSTRKLISLVGECPSQNWDRCIAEDHKMKVVLWARGYCEKDATGRIDRCTRREIGEDEAESLVDGH